MVAKTLVSCRYSLKGHWLTCKNAGSLNICYKFPSLIRCFWISFPLRNLRMSLAWVYHSQLICFPEMLGMMPCSIPRESQLRRQEALEVLCIQPLPCLSVTQSTLSKGHRQHALRSTWGFDPELSEPERVSDSLSKRGTNHPGSPGTEFPGTQNFQCWAWEF